ncbi:hypothetical protein [Kangiella sp.]|uniref:hypothetical protein n=1 Tax=Kangiella sp. TaxID=1920245 RepID=UPI0019B702B9|nr:hypothetical protein [Kangiella sp.]MBD3653099.1 hypothetical protein [Kangiella sp.]
MSKITILAGDFPSGNGHFSFRNFTLPGDSNHYLCETVNINQLESFNRINKEMVSMLGVGERTMRMLDDLTQDQVLFMARLKDKRRFVGLADKRTFDKMNMARRIEGNRSEALSKAPSAA